MPYQSAIFTFNKAQEEICLQLIEELRQQGLDIATQILPVSSFWAAEIDHQDYYKKMANSPTVTDIPNDFTNYNQT